MKTAIWHCPYCGCPLAPREEITIQAQVVLEDPEDGSDKIKETIAQEQVVRYYCADCGEEVEI